jgi:short-subunit dehydrogenase
MGELRGRTALLTGASRGIGVFIGRALADAGANLVVTDMHAESLEAIAIELQGTGVKVVPLLADLRDREELEGLVARAEVALGPIDILINNAAVAHLAFFHRTDEDALREMLQVNYLAPLILTRRVLPGMLRRQQGHIVTLSSLEGMKAIPFDSAYAGTKAAVLQWAAGLRQELAGTGVAVSVVSPGYVSDVGIFADRHARAPRLIGSNTAAQVARAVVRAIEQERHEVIVCPTPVRPLLAVNALSPNIGDRIVRLMGIVGLQRTLVSRRDLRPGR